MLGASLRLSYGHSPEPQTASQPHTGLPNHTADRPYRGVSAWNWEASPDLHRGQARTTGLSSIRNSPTFISTVPHQEHLGGTLAPSRRTNHHSLTMLTFPRATNADIA